MKIWLDLPDAGVKQLADEGQDLSRAALEALAIDAYRMVEDFEREGVTSARLWDKRQVERSADLGGERRPESLL